MAFLFCVAIARNIRSPALSQKAALHLPFPITTPPVKRSSGTPAGVPLLRNLKYYFRINILLLGGGSAYITMVMISAHSGRMTMLSRVVSTTLPSAKCSS